MDRSVSALGADELAFFRSNHYLALDGCMATGLADAWARKALAKRGILLDDPATWPSGHYFLPGAHAVAALSDLAPRAWQAACELVGGEARLQTPVAISDSLVVIANATADGESARHWWDPEHHLDTWHVDGDYNHFLDSPESGIMAIILFTEVTERGGATWIAPDSIAPVARALCDHPEGMSAFALREPGLIKNQCRRFVPLTGPAGRIYLMHPFMLHSISPNSLRCVRAIRNLGMELREPMRFDPAGRPLSEIERMTLRALECERLDFTAPDPGLRHPTDHDTGARQPLRPPAAPDSSQQPSILDAAALARLIQQPAQTGGRTSAVPPPQTAAAAPLVASPG